MGGTAVRQAKNLFGALKKHLADATAKPVKQQSQAAKPAPASHTRDWPEIFDPATGHSQR